jgi:ubiquinone biosynthesis protein
LHSKTVAHLGRFKDIVFALFRFGFDDIVERIDFPGKELFERMHRVDESMNTWKRTRLLLEELGPGFIKVGQILSLRPDIIPTELLLELRKLQDAVPPEAFDDIRKMMERELGGAIEEIFSYFDPRPLAGASLSQVHRAVLRESRLPVAVKVQRPGIRQLIEIDLDILDTLVGQVHERMEKFSHYNLPALAAEIRKTLIREIDFQREARYMGIVSNNLADEPSVHVPRVYEKFTTSKILTMELIVGDHLHNVEELPPACRRQLAITGLRLMIKQIFEDGIFHADPHPGNVLIIDDCVFCLLDWGMIGRLTAHSRHLVLDLIAAAIDRDSEKLLEIILTLVKTDKPVEMRQLEMDIMDMLDTYHSQPLQRIHIGRVLLELSEIIRKNRMRLPIDLALMIKAMVTAEGTARLLYPELNVIREAEPYIHRLSMARWTPASVFKNASRSFRQYAKLYNTLPAQLGEIIDKLGHGELAIRFKHENLPALLNSLDNITNRLTFGIIIGSLIIGSSMIITTGVKPHLFGFPVLGIIGYTVSGLLGLWLIFNIIRSRKL